MSEYRRHTPKEREEWAEAGELWVCPCCDYETHADRVGETCPACGEAAKDNTQC